MRKSRRTRHRLAPGAPRQPRGRRRSPDCRRSIGGHPRRPHLARRPRLLVRRARRCARAHCQLHPRSRSGHGHPAGPRGSQSKHRAHMAGRPRGRGRGRRLDAARSDGRRVFAESSAAPRHVAGRYRTPHCRLRRCRGARRPHWHGRDRAARRARLFAEFVSVTPRQPTHRRLRRGIRAPRAAAAGGGGRRACQVARAQAAVRAHLRRRLDRRRLGRRRQRATREAAQAARRGCD